MSDPKRSPCGGDLSVLGESQRFSLGRTLITPGARKLLDRVGLPAIALLALHAQGEWGALDAHDKAANEAAILEGGRILSRYELLKGDAVWIITDAVDDSGVRRATTVLLPAEY